MKKKIFIPLLIVLTLLLLCVTAVVVFTNSGYSFSKCRCIQMGNGEFMMVDENSPIVMNNRTKDTRFFAGLDTGDEILVLHDGIAESYPGKTGVYFIKKLSDGDISDIPEEVINSLTELGWYVTNSNVEYPDKDCDESLTPRDIDFNAICHHIGYNNDLDSPTVKIIRNTDELNAHHTEEHNDMMITESCDVYDEEYFKENYLILIYLSAYTGSLDYSVKNVTKNGDILTVTVESYCPVVYTDDMSGWLLFVELPNSVDIFGPEYVKVKEEVLESFSYDDDIFFLGDDTSGLVTKGFVNTEKHPIECEEDAIALAKNEVTISYTVASAAYDRYNDMWRVCFTTAVKEGAHTDSQYVYIYSTGITKAVIYVE